MPQRGDLISVESINVRTLLLQQRLHGLKVSIRGCAMEGCELLNRLVGSGGIDAVVEETLQEI